MAPRNDRRRGARADPEGRLPQGTVLLAGLSTLNVLLGFVREATVAYFFGTTQELDSFLVALTLPALLATSCTHITVSVILPPYVAHLENGDRSQATRLIQKWFAIISFAGVGVCLALGLLSHSVVSAIAPGMSAAGQEQAAIWLRTLLPYFWIMALAACFKVVLDSHRRFAPPILGRSAVSLAVVGCCLLLTPALGISALVWGYLVGGAIAFGVQWRISRSFEPAVPGRPKGGKPVDLPLAGGGAMALHALISPLDKVIDRGFASILPAGSIASLNYASSIISIPNTVFSSALATALFPLLSSQAARGEGEAAFRSAARWVLLTIAVGLIPVALLIAFRIEIVSTLFQRGQFGEEAVAACASLLSVLPFMIVLTGSTVILNRLLLAKNQFRFILCLTFCTIFFKFILNYLLVPRYGLVGLASATVAATTLTTALRFTYTFKKRKVTRYGTN